MKDIKLFVGVVSKNTVDAVVEYANRYNVLLGLIPSRRQVDYNDGYVNNWTTKTLSKYVRGKTNNVIIERDHGGKNQGYDNQNEYVSYKCDTEYFDGIHIDSFKTTHHSLTTAFDILSIGCNPRKLWFEIGTEESICKMSPGDLLKFIKEVRQKLPLENFEQIKYVVVQSGTKLKENMNVGNYDEKRLVNMINIVKSFGFKTKIHNGDYLSIDQIKRHYELGVDAINIAPEFGYIETCTYLDYMDDDKQFEMFYDLCYESGQWRKWVGEDFDPTNKKKLIEICGHYVFSTEKFQKIKPYIVCDNEIDEVVKTRIKQRIVQCIA